MNFELFKFLNVILNLVIKKVIEKKHPIKIDNCKTDTRF